MEIVSDIVKKIADKLSISVDDIDTTKRVPGKKEKPGNIEITFKNETTSTKWITAAKNSKLYAHDIMDNLSEATGKQLIYIREALSYYYNRKLLWEAKQKLKPSYKYVWCKRGIIRARKEEKGDIIIIRREEDIVRLVRA
ncbi:unnamed protein product [Parnassius apollo]|uniref:(apollo) hypothetical protein n=1 Tax=Parnassius apollo TaxID=110799 RepID=A0A8S3Y9Y0_PARAO|nr:unnamed protein product [Parnassius apollo]